MLSFIVVKFELIQSNVDKFLIEKYSSVVSAICSQFRLFEKL